MRLEELLGSSIHTVSVPLLNGPELVSLMQSSVKIRKLLQASPDTWKSLDASKLTLLEFKKLLHHAQHAKVCDRLTWLYLDWMPAETTVQILAYEGLREFPNLKAISVVGLGGFSAPCDIDDKYFPPIDEAEVHKVCKALVVAKGRKRFPLEYVAVIGGPHFEHSYSSRSSCKVSRYLTKYHVKSDLYFCVEKPCKSRKRPRLCDNIPRLCAKCGTSRTPCLDCLWLGQCTECNQYWCSDCVDELQKPGGDCEECDKMCEACEAAALGPGIEGVSQCWLCQGWVCTLHQASDTGSEEGCRSYCMDCTAQMYDSSYCY